MTTTAAPRSRPRRTLGLVKISIAITADRLDEVEALADTLGISRSAAIEWLLKAGLAAWPKTERAG